MSVVDAVIVHSGYKPEPKRAAWIASELEKRGLACIMRKYRSHGTLLQLLKIFRGEARHVVVLFSKTTTADIGAPVVEFSLEGGHPLPVRTEDHPKYGLLCDVVHADIFGENEAADLAQLERLVQAIQH